MQKVVRSSGSIGANYIEANESLYDKDFKFRVKISRKGAKETVYWLWLINETNDFKNKQIIKNLMQEALEIKKIYRRYSIILNRLVLPFVICVLRFVIYK